MTDVRDALDLASADLPDISFNETACDGGGLVVVAFESATHATTFRG